MNKIGDYGVIEFAKVFEWNRLCIGTVSFGSNSISDDGAFALSESLKSNEQLVSMDIFGNCITNVGGQFIKNAMDYNDTLGYIGDSLVGDSDLEFLMPIVQKNYDKLRTAPQKAARRRLGMYQALVRNWNSI